MNDLEQLHKALRREMLAGQAWRQARDQYKELPSDFNACQMQKGWKELRAAVDELVRMDQVSTDGAWLATWQQSATAIPQTSTRGAKPSKRK